MDERGATNLCGLLTLPVDPNETREHVPSSSLHLIVLQGTVPGQMIRLKPGTQSLGRAPECAVQLPDMSISRRHASLLVDDEERVWLTDDGSTNGTYLNGQRLAARRAVGLRDGDRLSLGPSVVLKFVHTDALDENHHRVMFERSVRDPLTELYNRDYFVTQLRVLVHQVHRRDLGIALVMLDVDHFKRINDTFGHARGDEVLKHVAVVLKQSTRGDDLVARYGGEEFIAALPIANVDQAVMRAERIRTALRRAAPLLDGRPLSVTASIGVSYGAPDKPQPIERMLAGADRALYRAKSAGRDRVVLDAEMVDRDAAEEQTGEFSIEPGRDPAGGIGRGLTTVDFDIYQGASI